MPADDTEPRQMPEEERRIREAALDQTIEGTFPASDPLSTVPNPHDCTVLEHGRTKRDDTHHDRRERSSVGRR
jgi:hypothetical protein